MKEVISIKRVADSDSEIVVGPLFESLRQLLPSKRVIVIADANVHRTNMELVDAYDHIIIGQGESNKTLATAEKIYRQLLAMDADRNTFLLGVGGGIVTDITGFVASTYMRGLDFGFVSTTLLGQVDASIGGKNGMNLDGFKNIIGVFRQPDFVICDPRMLDTLSDREFRSGMAEVIKAAIINDPELFAMLEEHSLEDLRSDHRLLTEVIIRAINVKASIVACDEHERGCRRLLNLGHTFAHAIEKGLANVSHGEAVAAGIVQISRVATDRGRLSQSDNERIERLIVKTGLPAQYEYETKKLLQWARGDKKREDGHIYLVYPTAIGHCEVEKISIDEFEKLFLTRE